MSSGAERRGVDRLVRGRREPDVDVRRVEVATSRRSRTPRPRWSGSASVLPDVVSTSAQVLSIAAVSVSASSSTVVPCETTQ